MVENIRSPKEALWKRVQRERREGSTAKREAVTDALTGLLNRRGFDARLDAAFSAFSKERRRGTDKISLIMADIDRFKNVNETYGHLAADAVLKTIGAILLKNARADSSARWGGEEFVILLDRVDQKTARTRAEQIRKQIEATAFEWAGVPLGTITMSFGISSTEQGAEAAEELLRQANVAMRSAKHAGRNRVIEFEPHLLLNERIPSGTEALQERKLK